MDLKQYRWVQIIGKLHMGLIKGATWASAAAMVVLTMVTAVNVFARYLFHKPMAGAIELSSLLLVATVFFGMAYTEVCKQHIVFQEVVDRMPRILRSILIRTMRFMGAIFFIILGWQSVVLAFHYMRPMLRMTNVLHIPISPAILVIAFGSFLMALQLFLECIFPGLTDLVIKLEKHKR